MKINFVKIIEEVLREHISRGVALPFNADINPSTGKPNDTIVYTKKFTKDLKNLVPQSKSEVQRFLDEYISSKGASPNKFEYKFKATQRIDQDLTERYNSRVPVRFNVYSVQIRHSKPSLHLLVAEGKGETEGRVIAFFRGFNDYNEYSRMLDIFRKTGN